MVKFMYNVREDVATLINKTVINVENPGKIIGYAEKGRLHDLQHTSLFLVCECKYINNTEVFSNPIAILALNQSEANSLYHEIVKNNNNCTVLCELENHCDKLKVEPIE